SGQPGRRAAGSIHPSRPEGLRRDHKEIAGPKVGRKDRPESRNSPSQGSPLLAEEGEGFADTPSQGDFLAVGERLQSGQKRGGSLVTVLRTTGQQPQDDRLEV